MHLNGITCRSSTFSRLARVVPTGALAVGSQAGPYSQPAKAVAVGATFIGFGADFVEQVVRPNPGQTTVNLLGNGANLILEPVPGGKLATPITNEIIESIKNSAPVRSLSERINKFLKPTSEPSRK